MNNPNNNANSPDWQVIGLKEQAVYSRDANEVSIGINSYTGQVVLLVVAPGGESLNMEYPASRDAMQHGIEMIVVAACAGATVPDDLPAVIGRLVSQTQQKLALCDVSPLQRGRGGAA